MIMLTRKTEYAIRALWELGRQPERLVTANEIAQRQGIPPKFLPQIVAELSQAGLLRSVRGYGGGLRLTHPAGEITLLAIIHAVQGELTVFECQQDDFDCIHHPVCDLRELYHRAQRAVENVFEKTVLSDLKLSRESHAAPEA
jgi:Rrf2 family protein